MKLLTYKTSKGTSYGAVAGQGVIDLGRRLGSKYPDLKALIAANAFGEAARLLKEAPDHKLSEIEFLPVIPNPGKIVCVGLNYQDHVVETGRDNTEQPAIFLRVAESQLGHKQPMPRPRESTHLDYEAEIAVIIGKGGRRIPGRTSPATAATTTARCATGSATPSSGPPARISTPPAPSARGWSPPTRFRPTPR
jgi:Fumarylacetoacetate (FAA) hydrolase family